MHRFGTSATTRLGNTRPTSTRSAALCASVATLLFCIFWALAPRPARACSCIRQTPTQAFEQADAVFEGRVDRIERVGGGPDIGPKWLQVGLHVVRAWKGADAEEVIVRTAGNSAACGYPFEEGKTYLVYATAGAEQLQVSLCGRTQPIEQADEDIEALGLATVPVDADEGEASADEAETKEEAEPKTGAQSPPSEQAGCASCHIGKSTPGTTAVFLLLWGLLRIRRGRGHRSTRRAPPPS